MLGQGFRGEARLRAEPRWQAQKDGGHQAGNRAGWSAGTRTRVRRPMRLSTIGLPLVTAWILWALAGGKGC